MVIKNGLILNKDFKFVKEDIAFGEKITEIGNNLKGEEEIDASGCYVIPGLIDTHLHGAVGENFVDFNPDTAQKICEFEAKSGTTTLIPTISAASKETMKNAVLYIASKSKDLPPICAKIMGIHLEGPFLSGQYPGSMLKEALRLPDMEEFDDLYNASEGMIKIISMAPELEGGYEAIEYLRSKNIAVSIGHSGATYAEALKAIELGACRTTHTFNAMSPLHHREPGVVGAAMLMDKVNCELICDFFHVNRDVVKLLYKVKGADRITMITDAEVGAGMPDGEFIVYGHKITVSDRKTYTEYGTIFGGTTVLLDGVRNLVSIGITLEDAIKMASINGALAAGIADRVGSLEEGKDADILILDQQLNLIKVILNGKVL